MAEKSKGQLLQDKLLHQPKNGGEVLTEQELKQVFSFCEGYKTFIDEAKMEREAVCFAIELLEKNGYTPFERTKKYKAGDKVYYNNRGRALIAAAVGSHSLAQGVHIVASHVDSPRVDLKPRPLYEEAQLAYFKTHYYGGIKKYQWAAVPLALHGVIIKKDGTALNVKIGEEESEPVFCITDLLPHLATEQSKRTLVEGIKGEELNILVGSLPFRDDKASEKVKLHIMNLLYEKYGIIEEDFLSAELCGVPSQKARDVGFDASMIGAYGHDDRVCAYASLMAQIAVEAPAVTSVLVLADKEETGSNGPTGLDSAYLRYFLADLAAPHGVEARELLSHSKCLSADVNAAFDPNFGDVHEKRNAAYLGYGVVVTKYTGSRGKNGTNDATAEIMSYVRGVLDGQNVLWQTGELGKVDAGGGGTVAQYVSQFDVDTVDIGVPVLSMHAPFEVVSKIDVYETFRACQAFLNA